MDVLKDNMGVSCNNIWDKLLHLHSLVRVNGANNLWDTSIRMEYFFKEFLDLLLGLDLVNANTDEANAKGIDLIDREKNVVVQVSSTFSHGKIQHSLDGVKDRSGGTFYFVAITEKTPNYRDLEVPAGWVFDEETHILDIARLMTLVMDAGIDKQKALSELVDKYFGSGTAMPAHRRLTRLPGRVDQNQVVGRENDIQRVTKQLAAGKSGILLHGLGGIGKTALAQLLLYAVEDEFDDVAWVPYHGSLKRSLLGSIELKGLPTEEGPRWNAIWSLGNEERKKLIIIDNADAIDGQDPARDPDLRDITGWRSTTVIVTSRLNRLWSYEPLSVQRLDNEGCVLLFCRYYGGDKTSENKGPIMELVRWAYGHSFTIQLLALAAKKEPSLAGYVEKLKKQGVLRSARKVEMNGREETIEHHLKCLFDMQRRTRRERRLLWIFSILPPNAELTAEELGEWFVLDGEKYQTALDHLERDGWLSSDRPGWYYINPTLARIVRLGRKPLFLERHFLKCVEGRKFFVNGEIYTDIQRKLEMVKSVLEAVDLKEKPKQYAHVCHILGSAYDDLAQYGAALEWHQKSLAVNEKLNPNSPNTAATYNNMALVYQARGDYDKALEYYEKALAIYEKVLGTDHPDTATTYNNLALVYDNMGNYDRALEYYEKALAIKEKVLRTDHPSTAATYDNLASVYDDMGDYGKALEYYGKARLIREKVLGTGHPSTATTYNNVAVVYKAQGDYDKALEYYGKARLIQEKVLGTGHPDTATTYHNIACVHYAKKEYDKAEELLLRAYRIYCDRLGPEHPSTKNTRYGLGLCYREHLDPTEDFDTWLEKRLNTP